LQHKSLTQLNKKVPPEVLAQDMKQIRTAITSAVSREKYKKDVVLDPDTNKYVVPGFCIKKGLAPILPVFLYGLTYGSAELRESSAAGMGEVLTVTTDVAVKPFLMKVTGPLIRVLGDRYQAPVKIETLGTILILLNKGGKRLRPFIPQLQTTFVKNLSDPSHIVRRLSTESLTRLMEYVTRVDQLVKELISAIKTTVGGVQHSMMLALHGVMSVKGGKMSSNMVTDATSTLLPLLDDSSMETQKVSAKCLGVLAHYIDANELNNIVIQIICSKASVENRWEDRYVCTHSLSSLLDHGRTHINPTNGLLQDEYIVTIIKTVQLLNEDSNGSVREGACQLTCSLLQMGLVRNGTTNGDGDGDGDNNGEEKNNEKNNEIENLACILLSKLATKDPSTDVRTAACMAIMRIARDTKEEYFNHKNVQKLLLPAVVSCAMNRKNVRMRTAADRALYFLFKMNEDVDTLEARVRKINKTVLKGAKGSADMITFTNSHWKKVARLIQEASWDL
jgi:hypothetical protein